LLAKAVCQATLMLDVMASSRASPLPHWICGADNFGCSLDPLWERACSRKRCVRRLWCWMWWPLREQARSHIGSASSPILNAAPIPCGSEPARESGVSGDLDAGCDGLFASKPAPTLDLHRRPFWMQPRSPVGASLLAKAVCQVTLMLDVMASSRASLLPHWICGADNFGCSPDPLWERACSRKRCVRRPWCWMWWPLRVGAAVPTILNAAPTPCGSEPARESGVSGDLDAGC